jgi:hypothetical protein
VTERRARHLATDTSAEYPAVFDKNRAFPARLRFRLGLKLDRGGHTARCSAGLLLAESRYTKTGLKRSGMNQSNCVVATICLGIGEVLVLAEHANSALAPEVDATALRLAVRSRATLKTRRVSE